ncbi:MAG: zinc ribbon domain-containing protein [Firmicutes bacterium]|nr:zinc ribbon domain-containing protein [Bacillota bacterium]
MTNPAFWFSWGIKLIVLGAMAVWLYRDARSRDYHWLMWTVTPVFLFFFSGLGWLLGAIFVLLLYLGLRPRGSLNGCPHCKKRVHDELAFCPFCRRSVKRECLRCHRTVPWEATVCPHCRSNALTDS